MDPAQAVRINLSDEDFDRMIAGQPVTFDLRPNTTKVIFKLQDNSKYLKSYHDIVSDIQRHLNLPPTRRI